jgi:hypothetical protein
MNGGFWIIDLANSDTVQYISTQGVVNFPNGIASTSSGSSVLVADAQYGGLAEYGLDGQLVKFYGNNHRNGFRRRFVLLRKVE